MGLPLPKPDLRQLVSAIHDHTELGKNDLERVLGPINLNAEMVIKQIIARAMDYGINAQRDAILEAPEFLPTPLPPSDPMPSTLPPPPRLPKLPKGVT